MKPGADMQAPTTPAGLAAQRISASQVKLSWSAAQDNVAVAGYRIYRGNSPTVQNYIGTTGNLTYSDTRASSNTLYYTVAAYDAAGNNSAKAPAAMVQ